MMMMMNNAVGLDLSCTRPPVFYRSGLLCLSRHVFSGQKGTDLVGDVSVDNPSQ